jgi:hypothetical protein
VSDIEVGYFAGWLDDLGDELPTGDNIEAARHTSDVIEARQERQAQRELDERRQEWEDLAEHRLKTAPTLAEVLEKTERRQRADDYRNDRAEAKARQKLLDNPVEERPDGLSDLELKARIDGFRPAKPGSLRWDKERRGGRAERPEAPSPWVRQAPTVAPTPLEPPR